MRINILILSFLFCGCAHHKRPTPNEIETHCQDLNILYQKVTAIAANIVNITTTRTSEGGYYKRKIVKNCRNGFCEIVNDDSPPILKYEPKHPDATEKGYVAYPNINLDSEKADMVQWKHVFETVIKYAPVDGDFFFKDARAKSCFDKYPTLKDRMDYSGYLGRETNLY